MKNAVMFNKGIRMSELVKILEYFYDKKLSFRKIALLTRVGKSTVHRYIAMFETSGLKWPLDPNVCVDFLSKKLKPQFVSKNTNSIDYTYIQKQLQRKNVTLKLLFKELKSQNKMHYSYSQFTRLISINKEQTCYMRQSYVNGEKVLVDYSGDKVKITQNNQDIFLEVFVGVLGASGYIYAEATYSQKLECFINSHTRMFEFFGGTPKIVVPDNLKSAITKASKNNPITNKEYQKMLDYYEIIALPARPYKPKDKSPVEKSVQIVQREILAVIRDETFSNIDDLNKRIKELVIQINSRKYSNKSVSRQDLFLEKDLPYLKKIKTPYEYLKHKQVIIGKDYHFKLNNVSYSVPYTLVNKTLDIYYSDLHLDCFFDGEKILSHQISKSDVTLFDHMPKNHQFVADTKKFITKDLGPNTKIIIDHIYDTNHKEISHRKSQYFLKIANKQDLELLCTKSIENNIYDYEQIMKLAKSELLASLRGPDIYQQPLKTFI